MVQRRTAMIVQISSGQGPAECERGVALLVDALRKEFPDIGILSECAGKEKDCYRSVLLSTESDLSFLEGSVQWICRSPFRPHHQRKNWFMDVSVIPEAECICAEGEIRFETFHASGRGGQNVNKVETGVRLLHVPSGITVTSTAQRSQHANKKDALCKLNAILQNQAESAKSKQTKEAWQEHTKIIRGNPVRVYEGIAFKQKTKGNQYG